MDPKRWLWIAASSSVLGCEPGDAPPPYVPVADVRQLMISVIEPAAETYWDAVGWILDFEGTHEIVPATPEEWQAVRNAAYVMAESGNLLMMEGRALDDGAWIVMSEAMIDVGRRALAAADSEDPETVFDVGAEVYAACSNCHAVYARETLRPSDARAN